MDCERVRAGLYAFLDGELDVKETIEVEEHIATCPMCDALVRYEERFRKQVLKMIKREPVPESLKKRIEVGLDAYTVSPFRWARLFTSGGARLIAATVAATLAILVLTNFIPDNPVTAKVEARQLVDDAIQAHLDYLNKKLEPEFTCTPDATTAQRWQQINGWFEGRLPFAVDMPAVDFEPLGGRLHFLGGGPAAYFVCTCQSSPEKHLSLFVFDAQKVKMPKNETVVSSNRKCAFSSTRGLISVMWENNGIAFLAVGNISRESMAKRLFASANSVVGTQPEAL